jgi:uncharacterized membrane protein YfcA
MDIFSAYTLLQWLAIGSAAFIIGLNKAGLKGMDMLSVTLMAFVFGSKSSTGVVLPLLCVADIAAVWYYNRHAQWHHFRRLVPWMMAGILLGVYWGNQMNEVRFKMVMACIIVVTIVIVLAMEYRKSATIPSNPLFAAGAGLSAGVTTMLGNLAGAFANLYFLAMRLPKNDFIGTAAWLFLFMNLFKLPFQVFFWHNINTKSLQTDLVLIPALALGFATGMWLVAKIQDTLYRKLVMVLTLVGCVMMLLK